MAYLATLPRALLIILFSLVAGQTQAQLTLSNRITGNNNWSVVNTWETGALNNSAITAGVTVTFNSTTNGINAGDLIYNNGGVLVGTVLSVVPGVSVTLTAPAAAAAAANTIRVRRVPVAADIVNVSGTANTNITVDGTYACNALNVQTASVNVNITLSITAGNSLTAGATAINNTSGGGSTNMVRIDVIGTFICSSLTEDPPGGDTRDDELRISGGTVTISGALTMNGTANRNAVTFNPNGILYIGGNFTGTCTLTQGTGTVDYNGTGAQTIPGYNYYNLTISGSRTTNNITLVNGGTIGVASIFNPAATFTSGSYVITNNTINFNGTGAQTLPAFNYNNLTISGARTTNSIAFDNTGMVGIANTLSLTATFTSGNYITTGNTIDYNGNAAQNIVANNAQFNYDNLTISIPSGAASRTKTAAGNITIGGNLVIQSNAGTNTCTLAPGGNNLNVNGTTNINAYGILNDATNGGTDIFTGAVIIAANGQYLNSANSANEFRNGITNNGTFTKSGSGSSTFTTNSQTLSGANVLTFSGGDLIISDPVSLNVSTSINFSGTNLTNNSNAAIAFNQTSGTFTFAPNAAQTVNNGAGTGSVAFYNLILAGGNTKTVNRPINVSNDLTINNGVTCTLDINATTFTINGSANIIGTFNLGTTAKTINVSGTLTVDGTLNFGTVAAKTVNLSGDLVDATGTITMTGAGLAHTLNLGGINNTISAFTTIAGSGSSVVYNRTGDQSVFVSANYQNLTLSNGGNKALQGNITVAGVLNLSSGVLQLGNSNLTVSNNAANAIQGTLSATSMVETEGATTGNFIRNAAAIAPILFPIGSDGLYDPVSITSVNPTTGTISARTEVFSTLGPNFISRYWDLATTTSNKTITAVFQYNSSETTVTPSLILYKPGAGSWQTPTGSASFGISTFTITGTTNLTTGTTTSWTAGALGAYYSYQTGNWDNPTTWTSDPGGTTQVGSTIPGNNDVVVILPGRTVTLPGNVATTGLNVTIREGGILDLSTYAFASPLAVLQGEGMLRLASVNFPATTVNTFINAGGGTTEYYNSANFTLPAAQTTYNHLNIKAPGVIATQLSNMTLNGDFYIKQGTFRINDNSSTTKRELIVYGDVTVDAGAFITVGNGSTNTTTTPTGITGGTAPYINYYEQFHRVVMYGDFTNNGTVRFTNLPYPIYNAFPPLGSAATSGAASVYFTGSTDNTLTCNGTTDLYNLILNKGSDQTFKLTIYSTAYSNFRLFGANIAGGDTPGSNPNLKKALWIRTGSLVLQGLTIIPSLSEGLCDGDPNSDFFVPANGALIIDGPEVVILSTADDYREVNVAYGVAAPDNATIGITQGGCSSFSLYGKLQINDGYFSTRESGGFITWDQASGQFELNGGTVDAKQFRAAGGAGGLASYVQSGGTLYLRGRFQRVPTQYTTVSNLTNVTTATLNTTRAGNGIDGTYGTLNINNAANVFAMSGGTIRIYDVCGTAAPTYAVEIRSSVANINVTGGTFELSPTTGTGTDVTNQLIYTTASFGNLTINRASSTSAIQLNTYPLTVLKNITLQSGSFDANNLDVAIGGNFSIASGTTYTPGTNRTIFNGSGNQSFTVNLAAALSINKLKIDKASTDALVFAGSQKTINVADTLWILNGRLDDNGNTINAATHIFNSGAHYGTGKIVMNSDAAQTINGDGTGIFENMEFNKPSAGTAAVTLLSDIIMNGTLTFSGAATGYKPFNIQGYNLALGSSASISGADANRYIQTNGDVGDGGVTKTYSSITAFTFPVGAPSTRHAAANYTPVTIGFTTAPSTFGSISVVPVGLEHPNTTAKNRSLTYFWRIKSTGFTGVGAGTVNHSYAYSVNDLVTAAGITEDEYVPARYNNTNFSWSRGTSASVDEVNHTMGAPWLSGIDNIDGDYTAGDDNPTNPFGAVVIIYSRRSGVWTDRLNWSLTSHTVDNPPATFPGANDPVIIGDNDSIYLTTIFGADNASPQSCASLMIETGSKLDIGNNPASNFGVVQSHPNGNGLFRLTTRNVHPRVFPFPAGDFSDFNINGGTTEFYTTDGAAGHIYILPPAVTTYGNLILTPLNQDNLILPNNTRTTIYGNLTCNAINPDAWLAMSWNYAGLYNPTVEKTVYVTGDVFVNGGTLIWMDDQAPQHLVVDGDIIVSPLAAIDVYQNYPINNGANPRFNSLEIGGSLINNSTNIDGRQLVRFIVGNNYCNVTFSGTDPAFISNATGTPTTIFNRLTLNKGTSQASTLTVNIGGTLTTPTNNWLTLQNGTLVYDRTGNFAISTTGTFTIPGTAGLHINTPSNVYIARSNVDNNDIYLNGKLTLEGGTVYVGQETAPNNNNDIEYSGGGLSEIEIQGGNLLVNGQIRRNPATTSGILKYTQSGGTLQVNGRNANTTNAKFEILNTGSTFNMSGGTITIIRGGGGTAYGDVYLRPASSSVSGGVVILGTVNVGVQSFRLDATAALNDLTINGVGGANTVNLMVNPLELNGTLLMSNTNSILNTNNINVTIKGDLTNNGNTACYNYGTNLTTFNGDIQAINGTSATNFYNLSVNPVTNLTLNKNVTVNNNITLGSGTLICANYAVNVKANVTNNATYTDTQYGIILNGTAQQRLFGTGTFGRLELNNTNGAKIENSIALQSDLVLTQGVLDINQYLLSLGQNSKIEGAPFGSSKMIISNGVYSNIGVRKYFNTGATSFTYPIGVSGKYTPAVLTITASSTVGYIRVNAINANHPAVTNPAEVLKYYWEMESSGITGFAGDIIFNYAQTDVQGTKEDEYVAARLIVPPGTSWSKATAGAGTDNVDESNNQISFTYSAGTTNLGGEYTAGLTTAIPDNVPVYQSISDGDWTDKNIWSPVAPTVDPCPDGGPNGFIVVINDSVVADADYCFAYRTTINDKLRIDSSFIGHNLGTVDGNGTLLLESSVLPAGRYNSFFDCANNGILEYGGSGTYTMIADLIDQVPNLFFSGTGTRVLPNKDLVICNELRINGPILDNSVYNRKLTIQGSMNRLSGTFTSGTLSGATVTFAGSSAQTVTNFTGASAFNNLEINNASGLTLTGPIEVKRNLLLTNGNITTTSTNLLRITYTAVNCVVPAGGKSSSYVNGPLSKRIIQGDNFNFPIGKGSYLGNKLSISATQTGTIDWVAEYFNPNSYTSVNAPLTAVNTKEYWTVTSASGDRCIITLAWDPQSDLTPLMTQNGLSDMRVADYDGSNWNEITSSASGDNFNGTVYTNSRVNIPASGTGIFTVGCINTTKPRATLSPTGPVCGTAGIPVTFSSSFPINLNYTLSYTIDNVAQTPVTVSSLPYILPTPSAGAYKLTAFTYNNGTGTGVVDQGTVTGYDIPTTANAGPNQSLCGATTATLAANTPVIGTGLWDILIGPGGTVVNPASPSSNFNGTNGTTYSLRWTITNGTCTSEDTVIIDFPLLPLQPDPFIASTSPVCQGQEDVVYTVPNDITVTYSWSYGGKGATISGTTNSVSVDFDITATSGILEVTATNGCGTSAPRSMAITVNVISTITLGANPSVCQGVNSADLSFSDTTGSPDQYSIVYSAAAISQGFVNVTNAPLGSSPVILVVPVAAVANVYNGDLTVRNSTTGCVSSIYSFTITILSLPLPTFTGIDTLCQGETAVYTTEAGMSNYTWTVSAGGSVASGGGAGDNSVTVEWNAVVFPPVPSPQTIAVNYTDANGCRAGSDEVFDVDVFKTPETGPAYYIPNDFEQ